jgi:Ca2+-binding RTX toxin-like protein
MGFRPTPRAALAAVSGTLHGGRGLASPAALLLLLAILLSAFFVALGQRSSTDARAAVAPPGQGFTVTAGDLHFILHQIQISEHHAATRSVSNPCGTLVGSGPNQIPDRLTSYGLRTVDGSCNNLFPGRERFAAADEQFPRQAKTPVFLDAEDSNIPGVGPVGPPGPTSFKSLRGNVVDSRPRTISNLVVDQTSTNPAAVAAANFPVRTQGQVGPNACSDPPSPHDLPTCVPVPHKTLFIPNVTTDVGLSPPYNSWFTFFGQFFDHGVDQTVKSGGAVFVPLKDDDPLRTLGPNGIAGDGDEVPASQAFMVLTRTQNTAGPDGILGNADDRKEATNTDTPWVDQSQTYTSHSAHQVFLREYRLEAGRPVSTGKLLGGSAPNQSGMADWESVKAQAANMLGLRLRDIEVNNIPMIAADPYGKFLPGPNGLPQYVTKNGPDGTPNTGDELVEGNLTNPVPPPADVLHFDTPFLTDIAHNADPGTVGPCDTQASGVPAGCLSPDTDTTASADFAHQPANTYDDEMLNRHFCAGDGRVNENIALTTVHQIFHSEHDRLVDYIDNIITSGQDSVGGTVSDADKAAWQAVGNPGDPNPGTYNYGERLFQAARFVTEMEYQHLVFEEFARKIQPAIKPFHIYSPDINAAIPAEFAHAVYRFGHSMLDDDVARTNIDGSNNDVPLLTAFLNPPEYFNGGTAGTLNPEQAAGSIVMGSVDQPGNELDEFVTETLRNNLLGLPLDLPSINMARARDAGVPPLNQLRRQLFNQTSDAQVAPYTDWSDFGQHLKHPESLINYVAAYGKHPSITSETTIAGKRSAARKIVDPDAALGDVAPADAADFMFSNGPVWGGVDANGLSKTGLDDVDLWVGGLGEVTNLFGGLLGSTFNHVFQHTLENLQDGDRLYYLNRTPGMNLRTQLEGNSFAEMVQRNTDGTNTLKADVFGTADCKFQLANLAGTPAGFTANGGTVLDDPSTECDESKVLQRSPDGTIAYRQRNTVDPSGINGQAVYNGTTGVDRVKGGNDNDTFWGNLGNDIIDGQGGDDVALGGEGDDVITDLDGADVPKGGDGNDAINAGTGDDIPMGGDGQDFIEGGTNDNETFAGPGDDFVNAGEGADVVFGDGGDDWIQGGLGQDLLQGDHSAPFFDDPGEQKPGNEVFVGQTGENDYDTEGGDDLMSQNPAVDRNAGAGGFDWAFHQYDEVPAANSTVTGADDDMEINNNLVGVPIQVVVNRDRWQETEADSGGPLDDVIRGTNDAPGDLGGAGFTGCNALDPAGVARINGLADIMPTATADRFPRPLQPIIGASAAGACPLVGQGATATNAGNVWAEGNILLGGGGSDQITGRGTDDIIDGDRALTVHIIVRNPAGGEFGRTDVMEGLPTSGNFGPGTAGMTLHQAVFAQLVNPGQLALARDIAIPANRPSVDCGVAAPKNCDTAVFLGPRSSYTITNNANGSVTINQIVAPVAPQKLSDGVDTLFNVERLQFADTTLTIVPSASLSAASLSFGNRGVGAAIAQSAPQTVTLTNSGLQPLNISTALGVTGTNAADFTVAAVAPACPATLSSGQSCAVTVRFKPAALGARSASLRLISNTGGIANSTTSIPLSGNGVANVAATGAPVVSDTIPQALRPLGVSTATIADSNGLGTFSFQWQRSATGAAGSWVNVAPLLGGTGPTVLLALNGQRYRVQVRFTDAAGYTEGLAGTCQAAGTTANPAGCPLTSAASEPTTASGTGGVVTPPSPLVAPAALRVTPAATTTAQPTALSVSAVSVAASPALKVSTAVPAGATTVRISVFRLGRSSRSTGRHARKVHVATVYRTTHTAKRYVFRLTEKKLRHLKPGRYLVEVRVGTSRAKLGPAKFRTVTIKRAKR